MRRSVAGIFVGGAARRMGGAVKGLLATADGEPIVDRWRRMLDALGVESVLVGARAEYAPRPCIDDAVAGAGPMGGLVALLRHAGDAHALALACDMPHVSPALLARLVHAPAAVALAPRRDGRWEPLFARYDAPRARTVAEARLAAGERSLQGLLDALGATELVLAPGEANELDDWDTMADVTRRPV